MAGLIDIGKHRRGEGEMATGRAASDGDATRVNCQLRLMLPHPPHGGLGILHLVDDARAVTAETPILDDDASRPAACHVGCCARYFRDGAYHPSAAVKKYDCRRRPRARTSVLWTEHVHMQAESINCLVNVRIRAIEPGRLLLCQRRVCQLRAEVCGK